MNNFYDPDDDEYINMNTIFDRAIMNKFDEILKNAHMAGDRKFI